MPKFQAGKSKTGGRRKGTPNKVTSDLIEALNALGVDLPASIAQDLRKLAAMERKLKRNPASVFAIIKFRTQVHLDLMQFVYPKRKPVDSKGNDDEGLGMTQIFLNIPSNGREAKD